MYNNQTVLYSSVADVQLKQCYTLLWLMYIVHTALTDLWPTRWLTPAITDREAKPLRNNINFIYIAGLSTIYIATGLSTINIAGLSTINNPCSSLHFMDHYY